MPIDLRTLMLMNLITNVVALVIMGILWGQYRRRYRGLTPWLVNIALQAIAIVLFVSRGRIPDFASIVLANLAVQTGTWLILAGLRDFFGRKRPQWPNIALLSAFAVAFTHAAVIVPNLRARTLLLSACMLILAAQIAWFTLASLPGESGSATRLTGFIALAYVAVNAVRIAVVLFSPSRGNDFYASTDLVTVIPILAYLILAMFLVLALVLLLNQRLLDDVRAQEEKFTKAFHAAPYAMVLTRMEDGAIFETNQGFEEITGYLRSEVLLKTTRDLKFWVNPENRKTFLNALIRHGSIRNMETDFRKKDGTLLTGMLSAETITIDGERCVITCIGDVTEQTRMREQLKELASHDALTGLANRRLFCDRFELALANATRNGRKMAVISLDLDNFKEINDTFGHESGDAVLTEAASRLDGSVRKMDTVARFGGDEFVILLWETIGASETAEVASRVLSNFKKPYEAPGRTIPMKVSLGIALYPDDGTDLATLLRKSDEALYYVKSHGRDGFRLASE